MANKKPKQGPGVVRPRKARRSAPAFLEPMAAQVVKQLPDGEVWLYEVKFDGYRALLTKDGQRVEIRSPEGQRAHPRCTRASPRRPFA